MLGTREVFGHNQFADCSVHYIHTVVGDLENVLLKRGNLAI